MYSLIFKQIKNNYSITLITVVFFLFYTYSSFLAHQVISLWNEVLNSIIIIIWYLAASGINKHYDTIIERIRGYYGIITDSSDLQKMIKKLEQINRY